jgi:asparagine synthase (glutamine-hydrolysing)
MCGIFGFNWNDSILFKKMSDSQEHRGPDSSGKFEDGLVSLGHRRLSIIDLSKDGNQPIFNEKNSKLIVFNGEIYNYRELRKELSRKHTFKTQTDTEVILHLYEEKGVNCLNFLEGVYSFCIYDIKKKELFIARDPLGVKPLYYYFDEEKFIFSSEIKSILKANIKTEISKESIAKYLRFHYIPDSSTLFSNIYKLEPGFYLNFNLFKKKLYKKKYWFLREKKINKSELEYIEELKKLLEYIIKIQMISDVPVGFYLSGGLDSSLVAAMASKVSSRKIHTFTVSFGEKYHNELRYANKVAKHINSYHNEFILDENLVLKEFNKITEYYGEPVGEGGAIPNYFLSKFVSNRGIKVVLAGEGGDEVFGGYDYYKLFERLNTIHKFIPEFIRKKIKFILPEKYKSIISIQSKEFDFLNNNFVMKYFDNTEIENLLGIKRTKIKVNQEGDFIKNFFNKCQYFDIKTQLSECFNTKFDRTTMANSIEGRVPLQSPKLVKYAMNIPPKFKFKNNTEKYILKKVAEDYLPKEIVSRKKEGYATPMESWVRIKFKDEILKSLKNSKLVKDGIFNKKEVSKIIDNYSNYNYLKIWILFALERWYCLNRKFVR